MNTDEKTIIDDYPEYQNTTTPNNVTDFNEYKTKTKPNKLDTRVNTFNSNYDLFTKYFSDYVYSSYKKGYDYDSKSDKGGVNMSEVNWQDKYLTSLDNNVKEINQNLINTENRISDMINKQILNSTHLDKQRHEEVLSINTKIDTTNKWIIGLVITTIIGVGAMAIGVVAMVISSII